MMYPALYQIAELLGLLFSPLPSPVRFTQVVEIFLQAPEMDRRTRNIYFQRAVSYINTISSLAVTSPSIVRACCKQFRTEGFSVYCPLVVY